MSVVSTNAIRVIKQRRTILAAPDIEVDRGERLAILGDNGSGKTTLLRVLANLERDYSGQCRISVPRREATFVHQHPWLFNGSVLANAIYGLTARRVRRRDARSRALDWLDRLGVADLASQSAQSLSAGELRRVALARALAIEPRLLLLDEPLADIDATGIAAVIDALNRLPDITLIIASPVDLPDGLVTRAVRLETPET